MPRKVSRSYAEMKKKHHGEMKEKAKAQMYLTGGQAKLDKNKNNRIDAQDFKILRKEKAKGRGMGLQDEKVKPGKVMKAKKGSALDLPVIKSVKPQPKLNPTKTNPNKPRFSSMEEMRRAKGFKPGESAASFNKRKAAAEFAKRAAKATGARGKIALGVAAAGVGAVQYLKSKMKKKKEEAKKKMGGGMMRKYKQGGRPAMAEAPAPDSPRKRQMARRPRSASDIRDEKLKPKRFDELIDAKRAGFKKLIRQSEEAEGASPKIYSQAKEKALKEYTDIKKSSFRDSAKTLMGGGMMNKPMGYKSGKSVKVKCKLGRNKPTKMY